MMRLVRGACVAGWTSMLLGAGLVPVTVSMTGWVAVRPRRRSFAATFVALALVCVSRDAHALVTPQVSITPDTVHPSRWSRVPQHTVIFNVVSLGHGGIVHVVAELPSRATIFTFGLAGTPSTPDSTWTSGASRPRYGKPGWVEWYGTTPIPQGGYPVGKIGFRLEGRTGELIFPVRVTYADSTTIEWRGQPGSAYPAPRVVVFNPSPTRTQLLVGAALLALVASMTVWVAVRNRRRSMALMLVVVAALGVPLGAHATASAQISITPDTIRPSLWSRVPQHELIISVAGADRGGVVHVVVEEPSRVEVRAFGPYLDKDADERGWRYTFTLAGNGKPGTLEWGGLAPLAGGVDPDVLVGFRLSGRTGVLVFPTRVTYADGTTIDWRGPPGSAYPAPRVVVFNPSPTRTQLLVGAGMLALVASMTVWVAVRNRRRLMIARDIS